jgi:hypothetical protein
MPTYRVYQVQEQIEIHKWLYEVEADSDDEAVEKAMNGEAKQVEQGTIGEPEYACWGWSARPVNVVEDDTAWDEAIADLEANRRENW